MFGQRLRVVVATLALIGAFWADAGAQLPLAPGSRTGLTVTPVFEGWYINPDGSFTLSFGYYNRNFEEVIEIPLGFENRIEPAEYDGIQPTHFENRRQWGVFGVRVPADFGDGRVEWTLWVRGQEFMVPGTLHVDYQIDALEGELSSNNTPPVLSFDGGAVTGAGPGGVTTGPISATVGEPLSLSVMATDDGAGMRSGRGGRGGGRGGAPVRVTLTWLKHQGPGDVEFGESAIVVREDDDGLVSNTATFSEPGDYIVRIRANDSSGVSGAGHAQCCWTNGYVKVTVSR